MKGDDNTTIRELKDLVNKFVEERNWQKHHSAKNVSMKLAIEAAELMEHFVWKRSGGPDQEEVADELADVFYNCLLFASTNKIDLSEALSKKVEKIRKKYPAELMRSSNDLSDYRKIQKAYREKKNEQGKV